MARPALRCWLMLLLALAACENAPTLMPGEEKGGGETSNLLAVGSNAFTFPAANIGGRTRARFFSGNAFFNQAWVAAPASTMARDGLGPLFQARSCSACHFRDGRAALPNEGEVVENAVIKLATADGQPDPRYGGQLQPFAVPGVIAEPVPTLVWEAIDLPAAPSLRRSVLRFEDGALGATHAGLRVAPIMVGLGLLEAIPADELEGLADPDDGNGDGISGRARRMEDGRVGRFGWRAGAASVADQVAAAFHGDMGLTSELRTEPTCMSTQSDCMSAPSGGEPEVDDSVFEAVVIYSQTLAVPGRADAAEPDVLAGRDLMDTLGCTSCHVQRYVTGDHEIPELAGQVIFPYTDLLLHDMGEGLADHAVEGDVEAQEWRTPPLWGVGRIEEVNGHRELLHDGRARGFDEAVLWHGGEASAARDSYLALDEHERAQLIRFLESL